MHRQVRCFAAAEDGLLPCTGLLFAYWSAATQHYCDRAELEASMHHVVLCLLPCSAHAAQNGAAAPYIFLQLSRRSQLDVHPVL